MSNPKALKSLFTELHESPGPYLWATQGPAPPRKCADLIFVPRVPSTEPAAGLQGGGKGGQRWVEEQVGVALLTGK